MFWDETMRPVEIIWDLERVAPNLACSDCSQVVGGWVFVATFALAADYASSFIIRG
jgi:hypothetical protein